MTKSQTLSLLSLCLSAAWSFIRSIGNGFNVSASLGAKAGIITAPSGADASIKATAAAEPAVKTLGETMRDAFGATDQDKIAIVNLATRKITIVPSGTAIAAVTGAAGLAAAGAITLDDPTKTTGPMSIEGGAGEVTDAVTLAITTASKPSFSVASVISKIEDEVTAPLGAPAVAGKSAIVVVNQEALTITLYSGDVGSVEAVDGAALLVEDAEFVQTLTPAGGRQFGE